MSLTALRSLVSLALASMSLAACSLPPSSEHGPHGDGGGASTSSTGGAGGAGGEVAFSPTTSASTGSSGFDACASSTQDAALVPVTMFIAADKSGSMAYDSKWAHVRSAFDTFFQDKKAASLGVALRLFPRGDCSAPACSVEACSEPDVDVGSLSDPAHVKALVSELASVTPSGDTPMSTAISGASKWAVARAEQAGESERVVIVLVTDGEPHGCNNSVQVIADRAQHAYTEAGVLTFAVGLAGSNEATMDQIAAAGHTGQGFFIGSGSAQQDLLAALQTIQTTSASCVYAMLKPAEGDTLEPQRVNVTTLPSGATTPETVDQVKDASSCGTAGGWHYDDPANPRFIELCPSTCEEVKADAGAKIQIVLGCATQIN